jgi:carbon monoxide dehydrogenase subunit G
MSATFEVSVPVAAPAQATWSVLTDWGRQSEWAVLTSTRGIGPTGGRALGEQVHAFTGIGRVGFLDTMVIERWEPPRLCRVRKTGRVVRGAAEFAVEPVGEAASRVTYRAEVQLPGGRVGMWVWPLVRAGFAAGFTRSLASLARIVEREQSAVGSPSAR